jgi:hypothetical protein
MAKTDLKRALQEFYFPSAREISVVKIPALNFLMIDGTGDPNVAQAYKDAVEALYAVSYALKFKMKKEQSVDYVMMPLEGLWWVDDMTQFSIENKAAWLWTMMIMQPQPVTAKMVQQVVAEVAKKKQLAALPQVRFEKFTEGLAAQIFYFGAYADEGPTIQKIHQHIRTTGHQLHGKHHEIYLGDPRKTAPAKLKTVIRQPMR